MGQQLHTQHTAAAHLLALQGDGQLALLLCMPDVVASEAQHRIVPAEVRLHQQCKPGMSSATVMPASPKKQSIAATAVAISTDIAGAVKT